MRTIIINAPLAEARARYAGEDLHKISGEIQVLLSDRDVIVTFRQKGSVTEARFEFDVI